MKIIGLDGRQLKLDLKPSSFPPRILCSEGHRHVRGWLKELYANQDILEEFVIPNSHSLKLDFFIPNLSLVIEVDGDQHREFNKHFHKDAAGFNRSIVNDKKKDNWCTLNGFRIVRVSDKVSEQEFYKIIND